MAARVKLVALQPIEHDGKPVAPGEPFQAEEAHVGQLLASGAAEVQASAKARAIPPPKG